MIRLICWVIVIMFALSVIGAAPWLVIVAGAVLYLTRRKT